ncbi:hypothetical protein T12_2731 [Trichinella patagoniensis]|uniref:Uncharacterized protein n=1 Tax=Trichinella patagoniensis TaxID=990121 RepID=A0A0V1A753_9BILA|nr:hypothetical protein T12_2731 [Trichinella patagoniensis]
MLLRTCNCFQRERECFWSVLEAWGSRQLLSISCFLAIVLTLRKCHLSKEKMEAIRKAPRPKNKHE